MKEKMIGIVTKAAFSMAIIVMSGCASNRINLVDNGMVTVERIPSKRVYVSRAYVYQDGDDLVISGILKRRYRTVVADRSHVDIAVLNPDGTTLKQVSKRYNPRLSRKKRRSFFTVRLPITPPQGTIIRVVHHRYSRKANKTFDCGKNLAIPDVKERI